MLTKEQNEIIELMKSKESDYRVVAVNSVAGAGKTYTAKKIVEALNPKRGLYTAFNKAIVDDSRSKITSIEVRTIHSLAYKFAENKSVKNLTYMDIIENITYSNKYDLIKILDMFCLSSYVNLDEFLIDFRTQNNDISNSILLLVKKYYNKMESNTMPATFNFLLKSLHIKLYNAKINGLNFSINYDLVILDECQDTTAVTLSIFSLINAKKKVILGDNYQNIYSFMNTVNAFDLLNNTINKRLTQSFRCSEEIGKIVEQYGKNYLNNDFIFKGSNTISKKIEKEAYLSRSNISLIETMHDFHKKNIHYSLVRNIDDIFELPISIYYASLGKNVTSKKYKYLNKIYLQYSLELETFNFYSYLEEIFKDDAEILRAIKLLQNLEAEKINIIQVRNKAIEMSDNPNIVLSTAHAFKGLEADKVYINDDLNKSLMIAIEKRKEFYNKNKKTAPLPENITNEFNVYYVALSRAKVELVNVADFVPDSNPLIITMDKLKELLEEKILTNTKKDNHKLYYFKVENN